MCLVKFINFYYKVNLCNSFMPNKYNINIFLINPYFNP